MYFFHFLPHSFTSNFTPLTHSLSFSLYMKTSFLLQKRLANYTIFFFSIVETKSTFNLYIRHIDEGYNFTSLQLLSFLHSSSSTRSIYHTSIINFTINLLNCHIIIDFSIAIKPTTISLFHYPPPYLPSPKFTYHVVLNLMGLKLGAIICECLVEKKYGQ